MNDTGIIKWIKDNLTLYMGDDPFFTHDWLAAITCRETGELINKYVLLGHDVLTIAGEMKGDFTQRPGETYKCYHGYGFTQIDIHSFPDFVQSGDWKDPGKVYAKTIAILQWNQKYLTDRFAILNGDSLKHYITAAWNCGVGNESKAISNAYDPDAYTAGHDYAKQVFEFIDIYNTL